MTIPAQHHGAARRILTSARILDRQWWRDFGKCLWCGFMVKGAKRPVAHGDCAEWYEAIYGKFDKGDEDGRGRQYD